MHYSRAMTRYLVALTFVLCACELRLHDRDTYSYCDSRGCYECDAYGCWSVTPPTQTCRGDWDCAAGCYCGADGTCIETGYCRSNSDSRSTCIPAPGPGMCTSDANCPSGEFCDERTGQCIPSQTCNDGQACPDGMVCDPARGTCIPTTCDQNTDCPTGFFCDLSNGLCVPSMTCQTDEDCKVLPGDLICDPDRHTCTPRDPGPGPDCTTNADCPTGQTCCNGECKAPPPPGPGTCTYDGECGGGDCRPDFRAVGLCHVPCTDDSQCGTGDTCQSGFCDINPNPTPVCVLNMQCPANNTCINGTCHTNCTLDTDCANPADFCDQGICQPDWRVVTECGVNSDCDVGAGEQCVNGQCRTRCMTDEQCALCEDGPTCVNGYCQTATP